MKFNFSNLLTSVLDSGKMTKKASINGVVLYDGISSIDNHTPIVVIATGLKKSSKNSKTGNMIQTWILIKNVHPTEAINNGEDYAICGACPHRKINDKRSCYVNPMSFGAVFRSYLKGNYPRYKASKHDHLFTGRKIRFGSYGDPVNIPYDLVQHLITLSSGHTGYTHQWTNPDFTEFSDFFMASVDSLDDFLAARDLGWSTFRVHPTNEIATNITCQGGVKTNCALCSLCNGASDRQRHISIVAHGNGAKYVN